MRTLSLLQTLGTRVAIRGHSPVATILGATLLAIAPPALADLSNGYKVVVSINGQYALNVGGGGGREPVAYEKAINQSGVNAMIGVAANQYAGAKAVLSGSGVADARVTSSTQYTFNLKPPAGANVKGGKLVLHVVLEGTATGNADLHALAAVQADFGNGTGSATISDDKTTRAEFDVVTSIAPFIEDLEKAEGTVHLHVDATAKLSGGGNASAGATASNNTRVTGFKVLNSAGSQVTGFAMVAAGGNIPESTGQGGGGGKTVAVEFFHAGFKHYFVSPNTAEIAKLDDGTFAGWSRTGETFNVNTVGTEGRAAVCRFFTVAFPPTSSHFYAPRGLGCEDTFSNDKWEYEGDVFSMALPDAAGNCPSGTIPVYRLYNNGQGGAPNHRFTTSLSTRSQMLAQGFVAEGAGIGVGMCSPQ